MLFEVCAVRVGRIDSQRRFSSVAPVFVDQCQHSERTSIADLIVHKITTPNMIPALRSKPDPTPVAQPQSSSFRLSFWYFEPFLTPKAFHPFVVHFPTFPVEQCSYTAVSVAEPASLAIFGTICLVACGRRRKS